MAEQRPQGKERVIVKRMKVLGEGGCGVDRKGRLILPC